MLFPKVNQIRFHISTTQCNTSLSENYVAHSITVVCVTSRIW